MGRLMGLDYGSKTVGVAVSDPLGITAQPLEIIRRKSESKLRQTLARIQELAQQLEVEEIVLGLPRHMNNDLGDRAQKSLEFKEMLEKRTGLNVILWDERLSSVAAHEALLAAGVKGKDHEKYVDEVAAAWILEGYMTWKSSRKEKENEQDESEKQN